MPQDDARRACEYCGRLFDPPHIPCSDGSEADQQRVAATANDAVCNVALKERGAQPPDGG